MASVQVEAENTELYRRDPSSRKERFIFFGFVTPAATRLELCLGTCVVLLLIIVLSISIALGVKNGQTQSATQVSCLTQDCLWEAAYILDNMNISVDPCTDFYEYVCGDFPAAHPRPDDAMDYTVFKMMSELNEKRLFGIMESEARNLSGKSAEKKLKDFFQSCKNTIHFLPDAGLPLVNTLKGHITSGWVPLGNFKPDNWDFYEALGMGMAEYNIHPFFSLAIKPSVHGMSVLGSGGPKYVTVQSAPNGAAFLLEEYNHTGSAKMQAYDRLIRNVIKQLRKDANITAASEAELNKWVLDIVSTEMEVQQVFQASAYAFDPDTLDIKALPSASSLWSSVFLLTFGQSNGTVNVDSRTFMSNMTDYITTLSKDASRSNIYIGWNVVKNFLQDLGPVYIHYYREFAAVKNGGEQPYPELADYCFHLSQSYLGYIIDHEYIRNFFTEYDLHTATAIGNSVASQLEEATQHYSWLFPSEKSIAQAKIASTRKEFGYPAGVFDSDEAINRQFEALKIGGNHFENLKSLLAQAQRNKKQELMNSRNLNISEWPSEDIYSAAAYYTSTSGELFVPAGILQHPIYDAHIPQYLVFGSLGRVVGRSLVKSIEYFLGELYYPNNTITESFDGWWSNVSLAKYEKGPKACSEGLFTNKSFDPWMGITTPVVASVVGETFLVEKGGLRAAYSGLQKYASGSKKEETLPGLAENSVNKLFFLSYGQTFCFSRSQKTSQTVADQLHLPEHLFLNTMMSQFKPFSETFQCGKSAPLAFNQAAECESY